MVNSMKKLYPTLVDNSQTAEGDSYGIFFPDISGCFSAADTDEEILDNAREAALLHISELGEVPEPTNLVDMIDGAKFAKKHAERLGLERYLFGFVDVDLSKLSGPAKRINITVPELALAKIDAAASSVGKSRSEFLTEAGLRAI